MPEKISAAYGTWTSRFTPQSVSVHVRLGDVQWTPDGTALLWTEGRSGRGVLVIREGNDVPRDLTERHDVRAGVGYGGGDFTAGRGFALFAGKDGRLYRVEYAGGDPRPVTPGFGVCAAPALSPDGKWVVYVHSYEGVDSLALVDSEGRRWPQRLMQGADFYMQPAWSPRGDRIAWVDWNHPNMPWDGTVLRCARVAGDFPQAEEVTVLAGAADVPVFQPAFSPDSSQLAYVEEREEWDSLVVLDLENGKKRILCSDAALAEPAWTQGMRVFGWSPDGGKIFFLRKEKGFSAIWCADAASGKASPHHPAPYSDLEQISVSPVSTALAYIASSSAIPRRILVQQEKRVSVQAHSCAERLPAEEHSVPEPFSWRAEEGSEVHGLYFPPHNPRYASKGLPPAVILLHGGPTGQVAAGYSSETQFFTSRGYACLAVNYRGSSGYGRSYRNALRGRWGELDVADAVAGAKSLCESGLADPARLVVKGGSAGGFTVLNCLARHPGFFRAGICLYPVVDLFTISAVTGKFEQHYVDSMVGRLPEDHEKFRDRSPLYQADRIRDPLIIFQGEEDTVVPPSQAGEIVRVLQENRVPHAYRLFPGEGHGWRKNETVVSYYTEVERFLGQYVVFA